MKFLGEWADLVTRDEHRFLLRQRYFHICALLYRPFLYIAVHCDQLQENPDVRTLARKAIHCSAMANDGVERRHRYDGLWFSCRLAGAHILTLLAAKKCGLLTPDCLDELGCTDRDLELAIQVNLDLLGYWSTENVDLLAFKEAIEDQIRRCEV